ncbi:MAG: enoyl-CoA hydratase-related protein [Myxococcota bacterium]
MTDWKHIRFEFDGPLAVLTIAREEALNAINADVLDELSGALDQVAADGSLRTLVLTGAGKAFVAGADIEAMRAMTEAEALAFSEKGHRLLARFEALPIPVIAAVNGFALGGGAELALACDFIHASERAKFGQPEVKLGVIPGFGGTQRLSRRVGIAMARELIYTGRIIRAEEAHRIGWVNAVHPPDELLDNVRKVAKEIEGVGPLALSSAKVVLRDGADLPLTEANQREAEAFASCFTTEDQREGMTAFVEKRPPAFKGR